MIVNYIPEGWEIITQRAHGLLAAQIAANWSRRIRTERWLETLLAIAEHDDAQVELEKDNLLTDQGGPVNFKMKDFELAYCTRTIDFALSKSRYVALLSSMHLAFVYGKDTRKSATAARFIKEQIALQKQWRKDLKITVSQANRDYRLLEWCDALSLLLCQHDNQPEGRAIEISNGPDDLNYRLIQLSPGTLTVDPWPFENQDFELYFETRLIPKLTFESSDDFCTEFRKARIIENRWLFKKRAAHG